MFILRICVVVGNLSIISLLSHTMSVSGDEPYLVRDGTRVVELRHEASGRKFNQRVQDISAVQLGVYFKLDPSTISLEPLFGINEPSLLADANGCFTGLAESAIEFNVYLVMGAPFEPTATAQILPPPSSGRLPVTPVGLPGYGGRRVNVARALWNKQGKLEPQRSLQGFMEKISDGNFNQPHILGLVREKLQNPRLEIFCSHGMVGDSEATKGKEFWCSSGLKFYAAEPKTDEVQTEPSSEPKPKGRSSKTSFAAEMNEIVERFEQLYTLFEKEVKEVGTSSEAIRNSLDLHHSTAKSVNVHKICSKAFNCSICASSLKDPSKCKQCHGLLCDACLTKWFQGKTNCPLCRKHGGFEKPPTWILMLISPVLEAFKNE